MMKENSFYKDLVNDKTHLYGDNGEIIAVLLRNKMLIPWVLSINFKSVSSLSENMEKNVEKLRDFLKDNFSLYVEYDDIRQAYNKGTFEAWLFEDPTQYEQVQIIAFSSL